MQQAKGLVDIGWVIAGHMDRVDLAAVVQAREEALRYLQRILPQFVWRITLVHRVELVRGARVEPIDLLDAIVAERLARQWDFVFGVTSADLETEFKDWMFGCPARSMAAAVLSTVRLDPLAWRDHSDGEERIEQIAHRLFALFLHLLGHLAGLDHCDQPTSAMYPIETVYDLDRIEGYDPESIQALADDLRDVADPRLEEERDAQRGWVGFYLRALWRGRDDVWDAIRANRPWTLLYRLNTLTTAAVSATLFLLMTAEAWDLGMGLSSAFIGELSLASLFLTTWFIIRRQGLLVRRMRPQWTEQTVVTNASIVLTILGGMAALYVVLFGMVGLLSLLLFRPHVIIGWISSLGGPPGPIHYMRLAGLIATLGLGIGALGATIEDQTDFRHIAFIDEET